MVAADPTGATMFESVLAGQLLAPEPGLTPLMVAIVTDNTVVAAGLRITEHPMLVLLRPGTADPAGDLAELAAAVAASGKPVVGFNGLHTTTTSLAEQWSAVTGEPPELRMTLRYHRLGTLIAPVGVPGAPRIAVLPDSADLDLLAGWWFAFEHETGVNSQPPAAPDPTMLRRAAARGQVVTLWCDQGRVVAAAGHTVVRHGAARIAPVYTPPEFRRRGYASAVTAAAVRSAQQLGAGEITLFTDVGYPPANEVYRKLGFLAIADFADYETPRGATPPAYPHSTGDINSPAG